MKLLREFIQTLLLLTEGRLEDVKKKYPDVDVEDLSMHDQSGNYAYVMWMAKQVDAGEEYSDVIQAMHAFHAQKQNLEKHDLNAYKTVDDLKSAIKSRKKIKTEGTDQIFENDSWIVLHIKTKKACVKLGARDTDWCITQATTQHWENYVGANTIFFFAVPIFSSSGKDMYAISVVRNAANRVKDVVVFDSSDRQISHSEAIDTLGEDVLENAQNFAETVPTTIEHEVRQGILSVEDLDDYLDTLHSEKAREVAVSKIEGGNIESYINSRHAAARAVAINSMPEEEVYERIQEFLSDPSVLVNRAAILMLPVDAEELLQLASDEDYDVWFLAMIQTNHLRGEFVKLSREAGKTGFIREAFAETSRIRNVSTALELLKCDVPDFIIELCSAIVLHELIDSDDEFKKQLTDDVLLRAVNNSKRRNYLYSILRRFGDNMSDEIKKAINSRISLL